MSRRAKLVPVVLACGVAGALSAEEAPDLSFLEYLGSWEEGDDEWLVVAEMAVGVDRSIAPIDAATIDAVTLAPAAKADTETETEAETMADRNTETSKEIDGVVEDTEAGDEGHETLAE